MQQAAVKHAYPWLAPEPVCFGISSIEIETPISHPELQAADFYQALKVLKYSDNKVLGRCIGEQGLAGVVNFINQQLIELGYVSTQVILPEQDLSTGHLRLTLIPGLIGEIRLRNSQDKTLNYRLPIQAGEILNIRKLEQILENFARLQGMQTTFDILPSQRSSEDAGYSDVVIIWEILEKHFFNVGLNDAGSQSSGKYQGYAGYTLENPLNFTDQLFFYYTRSLNDWNIEHTDFNNLYISYDVPYQNWLFNVNANQYTNIQELEGFEQWLDYKTVNKDFSFQAQRELGRSKYYRLSAYAQAYRKSASSFIEDVEIAVQRKRTAGWELGSKYQLQIGQQTLNTQFSYRKGTGMLGAKEDITGEGNSRASIWNAAVQYSILWQTPNNRFMYQLNWQAQWSPHDVVSQEAFSMGGRYNVRGYRPEQSILGNNGHYVQQTMHWFNPVAHFSLYAGLDQGLVSGEGTQYYSDRYLLGSVIGLRSQFKHMNGEFFIGRGLFAPKHIEKETVTGFNLSFNF